jgi:hypothetical protein
MATAGLSSVTNTNVANIAHIQQATNINLKNEGLGVKSNATLTNNAIQVPKTLANKLTDSVSQRAGEVASLTSHVITASDTNNARAGHQNAPVVTNPGVEMFQAKPRELSITEIHSAFVDLQTNRAQKGYNDVERASNMTYDGIVHSIQANRPENKQSRAFVDVQQPEVTSTIHLQA